MEFRRVLFGSEVHYEGEDYLIVGARDILAILG